MCVLSKFRLIRNPSAFQLKARLPSGSMGCQRLVGRTICKAKQAECDPRSILRTTNGIWPLGGTGLGGRCLLTGNHSFLGSRLYHRGLSEQRPMAADYLYSNRQGSRQRQGESLHYGLWGVWLQKQHYHTSAVIKEPVGSAACPQGGDGTGGHDTRRWDP